MANLILGTKKYEAKDGGCLADVIKSLQNANQISEGQVGKIPSSFYIGLHHLGFNVKNI